MNLLSDIEILFPGNNTSNPFPLLRDTLRKMPVVKYSIYIKRIMADIPDFRSIIGYIEINDTAKYNYSLSSSYDYEDYHYERIVSIPVTCEYNTVQLISKDKVYHKYTIHDTYDKALDYCEDILEKELSADCLISHNGKLISIVSNCFNCEADSDNEDYDGHPTTGERWTKNIEFM